MHVLMLRSWDVIPYSATYSSIPRVGVGGTEFQLLSHAGILRELGHEVTVLGVTREDVTENGVFFCGTGGKNHSVELLKSKYRNVDAVFVNIKTGLSELRTHLPNAHIVEVCQNGPHFENDKYIDIYAFVGYGQFAYYNAAFRAYRNKFMMLPSVPPLRSIYDAIGNVVEKNQIIWVGSYEKQGLRRWGKAMRHIFEKDPDLRWVLCGPSYGSRDGSRLPSSLLGLGLPRERLDFMNLPLAELAREIKSSKILLASLGGEDGPVSYLDGHALGVPVLCSDDIYGKYYNPEGTGLRCTNASDCLAALEFLLDHPDARNKMGEMGKKWIDNSFREERQAVYIEQIMEYVNLKRRFPFPEKSSVQSDRKFPIGFWMERLEIKLALLRNR